MGGGMSVATSGQGMTGEEERKRASRPFARGNFRSYKKSYRSPPRRVRLGSSISSIPPERFSFSTALPLTRNPPSQPFSSLPRVFLSLLAQRHRRGRW